MAAAYQMRNAVAHGYFKVDLEIVWKTIHRNLPGLYRQVQKVARELPADD
ncbi:HepT-like ribonuclease domain-containing protein [Azotobacter salinestris]